MVILSVLMGLMCFVFAMIYDEFRTFRKDLFKTRGELASLRHDRAHDRGALDEVLCRLEKQATASELEEIWITLETLKEQQKTLCDSAETGSKYARKILYILHYLEDSVCRIDSRSAEIEDRLSSPDTMADVPIGPKPDSDPDVDAQISKAMEEGVMNLLQYAAGKAPGVEVGLG